MHRIDNATNTASVPTPGAVGPNPDGFFTGGNPAGGVPATVVTSDWANAVQEEICQVIAAAGITLSKTVRTQLRDAINYLTQNSASNVATASGTDTYTATLSPAITAYTTNMLVRIIFTNANTGAATLNLNSIAAKNIKLPNGNALFAGDIPAGHHGLLWYDGTNMILLNPDQITAKLGRKGADIASATTTDLSAATGDYVNVTGTTTITGLGTATTGVMRTVNFTGILTLTHNSTSLILPSAANITTAAGDTAILRSLGSGNWKCVGYFRADGTSLVSAGPFIDSTALVKGSGDATKLLRIEVDGLTTGTTRVWTAPDTDIGCFTVQRVSSLSGAAATGTTAVPVDDTIPQNTEGDQYMSLAITPKATANILVIFGNINMAFSATANAGAVALFQDTTANALAVSHCASAQTHDPMCVPYLWVMAAGTVSSTTFKIRAGGATGATTTFNGALSARRYGGALASSMNILEFSA